MITILPIDGLPEIVPGDDLTTMVAAALANNAMVLEPADVLVVTQKIVSKAEGRFVALGDINPGEKALDLARVTGKDPRLVELVLRESDAIVRVAPNILITRHKLGFVMANAGIDASNIGPGQEDEVLLLPRDPDVSASRLGKALAAHLGKDIAIVISDSFGRPWRYGTVNVAIGASGLPALVDCRGEADRDGRCLQVAQLALADMIASAAGMVMGEGAEGLPVALVRGCDLAGASLPASALVRPVEEDLFR